MLGSLQQDTHWKHGLNTCSSKMCMTEDGKQVIVYGELPGVLGMRTICTYESATGQFQQLFQVKHEYKCYDLVSWNKADTRYLVICCEDALYVHDLSMSGNQVHKYCQLGLNPWRICRGPGEGTLLLVDRKSPESTNRILLLQWKDDSLQQFPDIEWHGGIIHDICYGGFNRAYVVCHTDCTISCFTVSGKQRGQVLWRRGGVNINVGDSDFQPICLCSDQSGNIYLLSGVYDQVLYIFAGDNGELLHTQDLQKFYTDIDLQSIGEQLIWKKGGLMVQMVKISSVLFIKVYIVVTHL